MRKCPVHNCPAKTGARIAIIVASVMTVITAVTLVLHFLQRAKAESNSKSRLTRADYFLFQKQKDRCKPHRSSWWQGQKDLNPVHGHRVSPHLRCIH